MLSETAGNILIALPCERRGNSIGYDEKCINSHSL